MMMLMSGGMNGMGNMFDNLFANVAPTSTNSTVSKEGE
jgi:hypothetical protein